MSEEGEHKKQSHQFKALVLKNLSIQATQPCTNICQIITPIICLIFTMLIRDVCISKIPSDNDTIFKQIPLIPQKFNDYTIQDLFPDLVYRDCSQWYNFEVKNKSDLDFIGSNDGINAKKGLLGKIPRTYKKRCDYNFSKTETEPMTRLYAPMFMSKNESVNKQILKVAQYFNDLPYEEVRFTKTIDKIPDGSVTFNIANKDRLEADLKINDLRVLEYHRIDGVTKIQYYVEKLDDFKSYYMVSEGFMGFQHAISSAFIEQSAKKKMEGGLLYMPFMPTPSLFVDLLVSTVTTILFPLSLSLLLPVFLYMIVLQKQQKLIQMMRMNGMKMRNYWLVNFIFNLCISLLTNIVFYLFGILFLDISFFTQTSKLILFIILLGWILVQIGMANFLQVFLNSSRAANIIGYLFAIWTNLVAATLNIAVFQYPRPMPLGYLVFPTFSFNRIFYIMFNACQNDSCIKNFSDLTDQAWTCIKVLYLSFLILQFLGMYLHEVIPQQFGTRQPLNFPIRALLKKIRGQNETVSFKQSIVYKSDSISENLNDEQAKKQKQRISDIVDYNDYAMIISSLRKVYENGKQAVKGMDLVISDKEVFGLLGPNGAGKTTLISMITGVFSPTNGNCYVGGYSILEDIQKVHLRIGVCPQFDLLWPQLTVEQHFYFYARLRGTPSSLQKKTVQDTLHDVNLTEFRKFKSTQLSGGMKRRLSVGISMVGNPRIVFLDEPTTGLDPQNRRNLWQVLNKCKQKRALFLTTHLMEQADALCHRIGIITDGVLRTIGIQQKLKRKYGKGYHLSINVEIQRNILRQYHKKSYLSVSQMEDEPVQQSILSQDIQHANTYAQGINSTQIQQKNQQKLQTIKNTIMKLFPKATLQRQINGYLRYNIGQVIISQAMKSLAECGMEQLENNWSISNSNLQDVFLQVVRKFDPQEAEQEQNMQMGRHTIQDVEQE